MVAPPPDASASDGSNRGGGVSKEEMRIPKTIRKRSLASKPMFRRCPRKRKRPRKHPKRSQSQEAATQVSETTESEETEETELEQEAATQASGSQVTVTEETESNPSAWMNRKGSAYRARFELFGHRIMCCGELAVVKSYDGNALYGVVFDSKPEVVLREELLRPGRDDWKRIEWEGDIVQTAQLRPLCPKCGICLGVGANAWSLCDGCGHRHPGCASTQLLDRVRYGDGDPFRRPAPNYDEGGGDDDSDDSESDDVDSGYGEGDGGESDGDGSDSSDDSDDSGGDSGDGDGERDGERDGDGGDDRGEDSDSDDSESDDVNSEYSKGDDGGSDDDGSDSSDDSDDSGSDSGDGDGGQDGEQDRDGGDDKEEDNNGDKDEDKDDKDIELATDVAGISNKRSYEDTKEKSSNGKRHRTLEDIVRSQMEKHMPASLKKMRKMS